jgi:hypothetical protein
VSQRNQARSVSLDENEDDIGSEGAIILDRAMYQNGGDYSFRKRSKLGGGQGIPPPITGIEHGSASVNQSITGNNGVKVTVISWNANNSSSSPSKRALNNQWVVIPS